MKLSLKITERDKKLLAGLAVLIVLAAFCLLISPMISARQQLKGDIADAQLEYTELLRRGVLASGLEEKEAELDAELDELEPLYSVMSSSEVDQLLTEPAVELGLAITDFTISMPTGYTQLTTYIPGGTDENEPVTYSEVYTAGVSLLLNGSQARLQAYLDMLFEQEPALRVTDFTWSSGSNGSMKLQLGLEVYMTDGYQEGFGSDTAEGDAEEAETGVDSAEDLSDE